MSTVEMKERERLINTIILCSLVGLFVALAVATVLVYEESASDHPQPPATPHDRGQLHAEETTTVRSGK